MTRARPGRRGRRGLLAGAWVGLVLFAAAPAGAHSVVYVRKSCEAPGTPTPCFLTMQEVMDWIWPAGGPARSGPGNRLVVDVGPGTFGQFRCASPGAYNSPPTRGWVTMRGAGRDRTELMFNSEGATPHPQAPFDVTNCESLDVRDLRLVGDCCGVSWIGGGSSTWTDVDLIAGSAETTAFSSGHQYTFAWYDHITCELEDPIAVHYFYNSRLVAQGYGLGNTGWAANCAEVWFYGGEIRTTWVDEPPADYWNGNSSAVFLSKRSDFRVFGSLLRSDTGVLTTYPVGQVGGLVHWPGIIGVHVAAGDNEFHMHGGTIEVDASGHDFADATGIWTELPIALIHTPETAFRIVAGGGGAQAYRTRGVGDPATADFVAAVRSPFLWPSGPHPPTVRPGVLQPFVRSFTGLDLFVETDCDSAGVCGGSGSEPHLMVYDEACSGPLDPSGGPWRDTTAKACRRQCISSPCSP